jgi:hypothetical protein
MAELGDDDFGKVKSNTICLNKTWFGKITFLHGLTII